MKLQMLITCSKTWSDLSADFRENIVVSGAPAGERGELPRETEKEWSREMVAFYRAAKNDKVLEDGREKV